MNQARNKIRQVNVVCEKDDRQVTKSSFIPLLLLEADRLRSSLFTWTCSSQRSDTYFMESVREMKHLRYHNLSFNSFTHLPDSITKLVTLITLEVKRSVDWASFSNLRFLYVDDLPEEKAALYSIASKVLTTIATPAFEKAYGRARSIHGARSDELKELKKTITTIQAVLLDAEKKQDNSTIVKGWIGRVRDVLNDAEDLFDVVATNDLLKQQKKVLKTVRVFFSELNPIASNDLWDEDTIRGDTMWSILSSDHSKGSKIIITTRHLSVAKAMRADKTLELKGLSKDASWTLFRRYAFTDDRENDPAWISIGERIVSKCVNVPLAIKSIASLLRVKDTIGEWKSLENEQLSKIGLSVKPIMSALRLSYDHLPCHLKNCFASCSLYPKDSNLKKQDLIYHWIAQGYIKLKKEETLAMVGHSYFMELFRRSFFQEAEMDRSYKMHDLVHDLAQDVAGEESCIITTQEMNQSRNKIRHVSVAYEIDDKSKNIPLLLLEADRLRSSLFICKQSCSTQFLDEQVTKFRFLRSLSLEDQLMESIPSSIEEMKHLRYLNLSGNKFKHLPDSITKLVNLITLDVSRCSYLVKLPREIRELVSLRHLINSECLNLVHMPPTLGELTSLEQLSEFKLSKSGDVNSCGLDALARLNLRGSLRIKYDTFVEWRKDDEMFECGQIPDVLETLEIHHYPNMRMPVWWKDINLPSRLPRLESLTIKFCINVSNLAPLRYLPFLGNLYIEDLPQLEYIEDEEMVASSTPFFPSLHTLTCMDLRNLMGWSRPKNTTAAPLKFPFLSTLYIDSCPNLKVRIASPNLVEEFTVYSCPKMELWEEGEEEERSLDWDSFSNLRLLHVNEIPEKSRLPDCLRQLTSLGILQIYNMYRK
ncbi:hypothetical protein V2J09_010052 [Rumex salicifolius]